MKTNAVEQKTKNTVVAATTENEQTQAVPAEKAKSPPPREETVRILSPGEEAKQDTTSPRPQSQENQCKKPVKPKTPELPISPAKSPLQEKAPEGQTELPGPS